MTELTRKIRQKISHPGLSCLPVIFFLAFLALSCAKQGFPPGGPIDKEPPRILATFPASGNVNTPIDSDIEIIFNEPINPKTVISSLYFSPRFEIEPKIKIKSDRIIIQPREPLLPDRTYLFTVGTDLKDAHNVKLDQAFSLAFSTGNSLDSGSISGTVFKEGKRTSGISVLLFDDLPDSSASPDSLKPDYVTQTGTDGNYAFEYIASGNYYLVAFDDKNKNRAINIDLEAVGLPFLPTNIRGKSEAIANVNIRLHRTEAGALSIKSSSVNLDGLLRIKFNRPITELESNRLFKSVSVIKLADSTNGPGLTHFPITPYPASEFLIAVESLVPELEYRISYDLSSIISDIDDSLKIISSNFTYNESKDLKPPRILYQIPAISNEAILMPGEGWEFYFSEPINIDLLQSGICVNNDAGDTLMVDLTSISPMLVSFRPRQLQFGAKYNLIIDPANLADFSGNRSTDSTIQFPFATVGIDTLGSVSGNVLMTDSTFAHATIIDFKPVKQGEGRAETIRLPRGQTQFSASLFPGYYTVSAWVDQNDNQLYDFGAIIPYHRAEPFTVLVDTFRIRTRFESAGVEIKF